MTWAQSASIHNSSNCSHEQLPGRTQCPITRRMDRGSIPRFSDAGSAPFRPAERGDPVLQETKERPSRVLIKTVEHVGALAVVLREEFGVPFCLYDAGTGHRISAD